MSSSGPPMLADELGYEIFAVPEGWGLDSTPVLTEIALRTARIQLASGVLSVWGRTPATLAMTAATLHQVCEGRYVLGLGASTRALAEGFHDTPFEHPAAKLRDAVTKVRALLAGQPAQLSHAPAARPLRLGQPPAPELPIWVAALGQHTTRVAAELGDGWIPALVARDRLPSWAAQLSQLREAAAPHARPLTVAAGPITAVDENADAARDIAASLHRLVPGRHGRRLRPVRVRPGLCRRGPGDHRREPAAQPATRDRPPRRPGRPRPARRLRNPRPGPRAAPALGPRRRHRHDPAATGHALAQHRSDPPGRSTKRPAGSAPKRPLRHRSRPGHTHRRRPEIAATPPAAGRPSSQMNTHDCRAVGAGNSSP